MKKSIVNRKKFISAIVAMVMAAGLMPIQPMADVMDMSVTASAESDKKTIAVLNIDKEDTPTVKAYQIIKGVYADDGMLLKYENRSELGNLKIADMEKPSENEITAIAKAIRKGQISIEGISMTRQEQTENANTVSYTTDVEPGMYLVLISNSKEGFLYNPVVVSANVESDSKTVTGGEVDMTSYFDFPAKAYVKSNKVTVDKSIVDENGNEANGLDGAFGDTVNFRIDKMTIPSYSKEYTSPVFKVTDTLEGSAFKGIQNMTVKVDGTPLAPSDATYTITATNKEGKETAVSVANNVITIENGTSFVLNFAESYLFENEGKAILIDYSSVITDTAGYNYSENQNVAKIEYTNGPDSTAEVKDVTYSYTFGISAKIDAEDDNPDPNQNKNKYIVYEITKVSEECHEYEEVVDGEGNIIQKNKKALAGAEFTLYNNYSRKDEDIVATTVSNEYGGVSFTGLKAGTYFLQETKPPKGYSLKETVYRIEIVPTFDDRGIMTNYTISTFIAAANGERGASVQTASYSNTPIVNEDGSVTNNIVIVNDNSNKLEIINTTLSKLPSTGGVGTVLITIGASLGMAYFLTMFFISKKKKLF